MKGRFLIWSLTGAVFLVTLGISSWRNGLWEPAPADKTNITAAPPAGNPTPIPAHPFARAPAPDPGFAASTPPSFPAAEAPPAPPPPPAPADDPQDAASFSPPAPAEDPQGPPTFSQPGPPEDPQGAAATFSPPDMTQTLLEGTPGVDNADVLARRERLRAQRRQAE